MARGPKAPKAIDALKHDAATRRNIPTAEMESFFRREEDTAPMPPKHYARTRPLPPGTTRTEEEPSVPEIIWNGARITITDEQAAELAETGTLTLSDAQLVWRGKDRQDWSDLVVNVPPLYIQEKIHPKAIIDDLKRRTAEKREATSDAPDLFADFNGIEPDQRAEFYQHEQHWSNRLILGDSLQVMASLSERESLKGKVQCIYFDPPYGIKFNSNWQVSTQSRDVKDGKQTDISREPEQVKAFRDTWKDGIHSYLTYLRDRLSAMRDLLTESGSIFVQIGDENVHRVRAVMDEVFGEANAGPTINYKTTSGLSSDFLAGSTDHILWYFRDRSRAKFRRLFNTKNPGEEGATQFTFVQSPDGALVRPRKADEIRLEPGWKLLAHADLTSTGFATTTNYEFEYQGKSYRLPSASLRWKTTEQGLKRLQRASRLLQMGRTPRYKRFLDDFPVYPLVDLWTDTGISGFADKKVYVVQTSPIVVSRCILMASDPGDLVFDQTCGSGTTAYVAEQLGRRWITVDTSRVALALARTRLMAARYPWYMLADSKDGRAKEAALTQTVPPETPIHNDLRQGFVYERAPHITLRSIANNSLIDDIWENWQAVLEPLRAELNAATSESWEEWQVPRELPATAPPAAAELHAKWWEVRIARQREIDASIAARADVEYLYDKPYTDPARVRVSGPFTVESLSPHRVLPASEGELIETIDAADGKRTAADADLAGADFSAIVIDYLKAEGVKQQAKGDRVTFESIAPWPGNFIGAAATFIEGESGPERRAAILIGPEYGTVGRQERVEEVAPPETFDFVLPEAASAVEAPEPVLFARLDDEALLSVGVPADWLADVRAATEEGFFALAEYLPAEASEALLEYAATGRLQRESPALQLLDACVSRLAETSSESLSQEALLHPDTLRRIRPIADQEELEQALAFPWEKWGVFLHPSQRELVGRSFSGPARVAGSAGTGKTIVAIHRAVRLARENPSARILLASFSEPLADAMAKKLLVLAPETGGIIPRITTASYRGIAEQMFQLEHGVRPRIASDAVLRERLRQAAAQAGLKGFSERFLLSEWANVVDAWNITSFEAYATVQRMGRKSRLGPNQRERLWPVFEAVRGALAAERYTTWAEVFTGLAASWVAKPKKPFDHVVLDEAQDLAPAELRFFAALAPAAPDALFLAGDMGQRIFQHPYSWASLGVDVRGRSHSLKVCYRTSQQIRRAADKLLPPVLRDVDGAEDERRGIVSVFDGPAPQVETFASEEEEAAAVRGTIAGWLGEGIEPHEIGIFLRTPDLVARARAALSGVAGADRIVTAPMHLAKGLEFRAVAVMACDEGVLPLDERVADAADEAELDDIYETERRLLYVAATRAREHLLLTGVAPASEYLADFTDSSRSAASGDG